jgi:hypothetical protein
MSITTAHVRTLQQTNGVDVTIRRGAQTCALTAVPVSSVANVVGKDGSFTEVTVDDWVVLVSAWTIQQPAHPIKGDEITIDGSTDRYLVSHPDATKPVFYNFNHCDRPAVAWQLHSVPR